MKLAVRDAHIEKDREEIIRFLFDNLTKASNAERFDWLYLQNPFGMARAWIAFDSDTANTVGIAAAFPRNFLFGGRERRAWVLGDFCISNDCRSLGPAVQLQRACINALAGEPWYDFPSRSMMAIYRRIGLEPLGNVIRYSKLLRIDRKIEQVLPVKPVARAVSVAGNTLLRVRSRVQTGSALKAALFNEEFGPAFDSFGSGSLPGCEIQGMRTSHFLNWRYRKHPAGDISVVVTRDGSDLRGYAIAEVAQRDAILSDVQAKDQDTLGVLLNHLTGILIEKRVDTFSAPLMATASVRQCLEAAGFRPRETSPVVAHGMIPEGCLLLAGDRD